MAAAAGAASVSEPNPGRPSPFPHAAPPPCPFITGNLKCGVVRPGYTVPPQFAAQVAAALPPLWVGGFPDGDRPLLGLLPLPDMVRL